MLISEGQIEFDTHNLRVLVACLVVFVLSDLIATPNAETIWTNYINLVLMIVWLTVGLPHAMLVLVGGLSITTLVRLSPIKPRILPQYYNQSPYQLGLERLALSGMSLMVTGVIFNLLDGSFPDPTFNINNLAPIVPVFIALLGGLITIQLFDRFLFTPTDESQPINGWQVGLEIASLMVVPAMTLIYVRSGFFPFVAIMGLIVVQILRHQQVNETRQTLLRRINQLTTLNVVSEQLATSLVTSDVLKNIYESVAQVVDLTAFYIALHDSDYQRTDFPIAVSDGDIIDLPSRPSQDFHITDHIIDQKTVLNLTRSQFNNYEFSVPDNFEFKHYFGLPLMVGTKIMGVMGIMTDTRLTDQQINTLRTISGQASLAIRNTKLYGESVDLAKNLSQINQSVQDIMFNLDSDDAVNVACKTAVQIVNADMAIMFSQDIQHDELISVVHHQGVQPEHLALYKDEKYLPQLQHENIIVTENVSNLSEDAPLYHVGQVSGAQTIAEIPLKSGNLPVGQLTLFHAKPYVYPETKIRLLESLAYQLTAALDNADLLKSLELYASEQAQLVHLSRITTSSFNLNEIVEGISQMLQQMLNVERVTIGLLQNNGYLNLFGDVSQNSPERLYLDEVTELQTMRTQSHPRIFHHKDIDLSEQLRDFMLTSGDKTLICLPMVANRNLLGIIMLRQSDNRVFADSEWRLIEMATNQISTQLHNSQMYERTNQALDRRLNELSLIEEIAQKISGAQDTNLLIRNVLDAVSTATESEFAAIGIFDAKDQLQIMSRELESGVWGDYIILEGVTNSLMHRVVKTGETLIVKDNRNEADYHKVDTHNEYISSLLVPLVLEGQIIGALNLESTKLGFYRKEHVDFVRSVAGHAVISIKTARLLDERKNQVETLTSLRDLAVRLALDSNASQIIAVEGVLRTALDILEGQTGRLFLSLPDSNDLVELQSMTNDGDPNAYIPASLLHKTVSTGQIQAINDVSVLPDFDGVSFDELGYTSLIIAPIKRGTLVKEILAITFEQAKDFTDTDRSNIDLLTIQAASHLENTALINRIRTFGNRMRAIMDSTRDGIILLDARGYLIEANNAAERLLEMSLEQVKGENFAEFIMKGIREGTIVDDVEGEGLKEMARFLRLRPQDITTRPLQIRNGTNIRYIQEVGSPVVDSQSDEVGRLLTLRDVTEERLLAEFQDEISHMVVHDLRSPLSTITSSIHLAIDILKESSDHGTRDMTIPTLDVSLDSAGALMELIDTLLDIAKMETRKITLKRSEQSVKLLARTAFNQLAQSIQEANINVDMQIPEDLPKVDVDSDKIRRVIVNLLDNAVRYSPHGGDIQIVAKPYSEHKILILIADSGKGIPLEQSDHVFEKFRQIKGNVPRGRKGSGLGLTFCRLALEAHGESIWVEQQNRPLSGACIAFTLPIFDPKNHIRTDEVPITMLEGTSS